MAVAEAHDAAVLEEAADDTLHADVLGQSRHAGRRQQMPRMTRSIFTPAREASYSASMSLASTSEFILAQIAAGFPP